MGIHFKIIFAVLLFFSLSCKNQKHKDELQFYYYPDKNVYYDPIKKQFLYSLNGAKSWSTFYDTNIAEPMSMGEKVVVVSPIAAVYKDNENHRKLYHGRLYNISSGDTGTVAAGPEAIERKVAQKKKQVVAKRPGANKNKNNIGSFLNKIFGKHK